jgi:hypothetical protein
VKYSRRIKTKHSKKWLLAILVILLGGLVYLAHRHYKNDFAQPLKLNSNQAQIDKGRVEGKYLLNGTVVWARAVEKYANGNYAQPFSQLNTFDRSKYDAWSTDFECPITANAVPYQTQVNNLIFNCRPEFLPEATKFFNIYDLANNHTDNQNGEVGLNITRQNLEKAGVQYFGTFNPGDYKHTCEVIALPIRVIKNDGKTDMANLPVAFCGWEYFNAKPKEGELAVMDKYTAIMPTFAFVEMGVEYRAKADETQMAIAHQIVDHNPEFLIANNPHWVQNTEVYKNKLIVYSTGNFIFDQIDNETQRSGSIDLQISANYDDNLANWLAFGPQCKKFQDNCLEMAEQQNLIKPKLSYKYGVVAGQNGAGKITHKADQATQKAVEERMNWSQTCSQLGYNACQ